MSMIKCPACKHLMGSMPSEHDGGLQCTNCSVVLRVKTANNFAVNVAIAKILLETPPGLPSGLARVFSEAIDCFNAGSALGAVVLSRLFVDGLMTEAGIGKDQLIQKIEAARTTGLISQHAFHSATSSRLIGNAGAHYSDELESITLGQAEMVLHQVYQIALAIIPKLQSAPTPVERKP